jgi:homoserine kinase type II
MSVFTPVTPGQLSTWLRNYSIGTLTRLEGIAAGIENTNYFVTTTHGRYVLTLFEKLKASELPFYLNLMAHLARHGIPSPRPIADLGGEYLGALNGKPASIVTCLPGADLAQVNAVHCATIGGLLAKMHLAGASYRAAMPNPRGPKWWRAAMPNVLPFLDQRATALLKDEIRVQSRHRFADLPRGVIHADLFRDNVLWDDDHVGGIIDFYFACNDVLLYDVAIAVNDWCIEADATLSRERTTALLAAYHSARPFTAIERGAWPVMLRAGTLRFWISRLYDLYRPRPGLLTHAKDPQHFQYILERHIERDAELRQLLVQLR